MRISSAQLHQTSLQNIQTNQKAFFDRSLEASSGLKLQRASDDPVAAGRIRRMNTEITQLETYKKNLSNGTMRLSLQETRLNEAYNTLLQAQEMVLMASDGSFGTGEAKGLGSELSALVDNFVSAFNAQDNEGNYLFSGSFIEAPAIEEVNGVWVVAGDNQAPKVRAASNLEVQSGITLADVIPNLDIVNQLAELAEKLEGGVEAQSLAKSLIEPTSELIDANISAVTQVGTLASNLDNLSDNIMEQISATENFRGLLQDADFAEATMEMQQSLTAFEASLQVYRNISSLNLFSTR